MEISDFAKIQLTLPDKIDPADEMSWQHYLYSKLGSKKEVVVEIKDKEKQVEELVERIVAMAKVLYGLHMVRISRLLTDVSSQFLQFLLPSAILLFDSAKEHRICTCFTCLVRRLKDDKYRIFFRTFN